MSSVDGVLFTNTEGPDWVRSIARGRARVNQVAAQIRFLLSNKLSAASGGTVMGKEDGLGNSPAGQPPLARGVFSPSILSPVAAQPNTSRGDESSVNGTATGGNQHSCAVGSATAGRDRRNLWESAPVRSQVGGVKSQPCNRRIGAGAPAQFLPLCTTSSAWSRDVRNCTGRHGPEASEPVNARTQRKSSSTGDRGESAAQI